jgi:hypothetical protein
VVRRQMGAAHGPLNCTVPQGVARPREYSRPP